ncbi:hypothetical protein [Nocardia sp. NPDC050412]
MLSYPRWMLISGTDAPQMVECGPGPTATSWDVVTLDPEYLRRQQT